MAMINNGVLNLSGALQFKGGNHETLSTENPLLAERELCVEADTGKIKAGNGIDYYNNLLYIGHNNFRY